SRVWRPRSPTPCCSAPCTSTRPWPSSSRPSWASSSRWESKPPGSCPDLQHGPPLEREDRSGRGLAGIRGTGEVAGGAGVAAVAEVAHLGTGAGREASRHRPDLGAIELHQGLPAEPQLTVRFSQDLLLLNEMLPG